MQTNLSEKYRHTTEGKLADSILRSCVHCGFCTATCPTYQILNDELDSPRGRIYLIKQIFEGQTVTKKTQLHLDRCLTCRACETTCPSGVRYAQLLEIGRRIVEREVPRPIALKRKLLRLILPYPRRFALFLNLGKLLKPLLPSALKRKIPKVQKQQTLAPSQTLPRKMLLLEGCVQSVVTANTNTATKRILNKFGIQLISATKAGCCGAVSYHLSAEKEGMTAMRRNIDAWWDYIETENIEAIVITASGCGSMIKEYGTIFKDEPNYAEKAQRISKLAKDISEILDTEDISKLTIDPNIYKKYPAISFHSPCTLQHGQQLNGIVEKTLKTTGFKLLPIKDTHLCCGSAGTYSILQPELSQQLLKNKLQALQEHNPSLITTANIGCQLHLASQANVEVKHWIELVDEAVR